MNLHAYMPILFRSARILLKNVLWFFVAVADEMIVILRTSFRCLRLPIVFVPVLIFAVVMAWIIQP